MVIVSSKFFNFKGVETMISTRTFTEKVAVLAVRAIKGTGVLVLNVGSRTEAQDLIEYAMMAGFIAVAAGAIMPGVASEVSVIFSKVSSALVAAGG
jgi:Flp pilus assembly pilin Flp